MKVFSVYSQFCFGKRIVVQNLFGAHGLGRDEDLPVRRAGDTFPCPKNGFVIQQASIDIGV